MDADELLKLLKLARAGGGDLAWLRRKSTQLVEEALELERLRDAMGPQRLEAMQRRRRVLALHRQGVPASVIVARLGLSRSRVYQLLDNPAVLSGDENFWKEISESKSS